MTGTYPGLPRVPNVETVVGLSLLGLLILAAGIRLGISILHNNAPLEREAYVLADTGHMTNAIPRLCIWLIGLYTLNWFVRIAPMLLFFDAAQVIYNLLALRTILFAMLFLLVLRTQTGYGYAIAAFAYVLLPQLASMMSHFKESFFILLLAILGQWCPWLQSTNHLRYARLWCAMGALAAALLGMAIFWEGGIKPIWRPAMMSGEIHGSPLQKINAFVSVVQTAAQRLDVSQATEDLASRMASGLGYFAHVRERVPALLPYEQGRLTLRAVTHVVQPRFLFPHKPNLGGDSWLVRKYAGVNVADDKRGTSVGLSYMAEFYIDFGFPGMFVPLFCYGCLIGIVYQSIRRAAPSSLWFQSTVMIIFLQHFMTYEGEIAKLLGGLIQTWLLFLLFLYVGAPWIHRHLFAPVFAPAEPSSATQDTA